MVTEYYYPYNPEYWANNKESITIKRKMRKDRDPKTFLEVARRGKNRIKAKARDLLLQIKANPCMDCGTIFPSYVMDFDHRPGEVKINTVGRLVQEGYSLKRILTEIKKCDLVCVNCHRNRTFVVSDVRKHGIVKNEKHAKARALRVSIVKDFKANKPCVDCSVFYDSHVMDLDHRSMRDKKFTISSKLSSIEIDKLLLELKKCDVVCANCHRIRTHKQLSVIQQRKHNL